MERTLLFYSEVRDCNLGSQTSEQSHYEVAANTQLTFCNWSEYSVLPSLLVMKTSSL